MSAKLIFITGMLGIGGYVGHTAMKHDPTVYEMARPQAQRILENGRTAVPRKDGDGTIEIWGGQASTQGVTINMRYGAGMPTLTCETVLTAISATETRVVPNCDQDTPGDSAIAKTTSALRTPMFEEHIRAQLTGQPFNREHVDSREMGIVLNNVGAMNREAMVEADHAQAASAEYERANPSR